MELISVIVPVYKVEEYLDECIESIVRQTYENIEIILVDDGSPDTCPEKCDEWGEKDHRIKVIHKKNGGLSDARNAGMGIAAGQYIAFVDSDDWVEETYVECLYRAIQETGADIAACDVREVRSSKDVPTIDAGEGNTVKCTPAEALSELLKGRTFRAVAWNKLYRADLLKDESFEVGRLHEDEFFSYRIFDKAAYLCYTDLPLYNYRQREGSIMTNLTIKRLDSLEAYLGRLDLLKKKYRKLYQKDKITFCLTCLSFYTDTYVRVYEDAASVRRKIKQYRRTVRFSIRDLTQYSLKNVVYIVGSSPLFIECFSKLRAGRGKG